MADRTKNLNDLYTFIELNNKLPSYETKLGQ